MVRVKNNLIFNLAEPDGVALDLDFYTPLLEASFKEAGFHDTFLISDILMALNLFSQKKPLDSEGIESLLLRILVDNGLLDVASNLKQLLGTEAQSIHERISLVFRELPEGCPEGLVSRIEERLLLAAYQLDDLSPAFLKALCHEELRLWKQASAEFKVDSPILMPDQSLRDSLQLRPSDVPWSWDELRIYFGGYFYKSLCVEVDCEAIQKRLGEPVMEIVFLKVFKDLVNQATDYLSKVLAKHELNGGECDYMSVRMACTSEGLGKRVNNGGFSEELELCLRESFETFSKKRSLFFHLGR